MHMFDDNIRYSISCLNFKYFLHVDDVRNQI